MADFDKELEIIKELLTKTYEDGKKEGEQGSFGRGEVYRHKRLEEKGMSFNVGDKVRTTTNYNWAGRKVFACGTIGTIVEKHMSKIYGIMLYEVKSEDELELKTYLYGVADLELVKPAKVPVEVGSIVKIVKEYNDFNPSCHLFSKGTLGVITDIREDRQEHSTNGSYKYRIENTNDIFFYDRDGFEVITRVEEDK